MPHPRTIFARAAATVLAVAGAGRAQPHQHFAVELAAPAGAQTPFDNAAVTRCFGFAETTLCRAT